MPEGLSVEYSWVEESGEEDEDSRISLHLCATLASEFQVPKIITGKLSGAAFVNYAPDKNGKKKRSYDTK